jgi:hypothetical protein
VTISENANKAAQWWTDQLISSSVKHDDGANDVNIFAMLSLSWSKAAYSEKQIELFKSTLVDCIEGEVAKCGFCTISVDYHPCRILSKAAKVSGIEQGVLALPWKTLTQTFKDKTVLSHGYGAPPVEL